MKSGLEMLPEGKNFISLEEWQEGLKHRKRPVSIDRPHLANNEQVAPVVHSTKGLLELAAKIRKINSLLSS